MTNFVHLHVHTEYSPLDGAGRVKELVSRAKELGQTALAITDHGNVFGIYDFYKECKKQDIKPILGCEFYLNYEGGSYHLLVLAKSYDGVKNIYKLQQYAYTTGYEGKKPGISLDMLKKYKKDLIITTACLGGLIPQQIMDGKSAGNVLKAFADAFGPDFYLEIQDNTIPEQYHLNKELIKLADRYGIPLVVACDVHYTLKEDAYPHEVLLALQTQKKMDDPNRFKFSVNDFWLKSEEEVRERLTYLDPSIVDRAIANTKLIADQVNIEFVDGQNYLPEFVCPPGMTEADYLSELIAKGMKTRGLSNNPEAWGRLQYEFDVIVAKGYQGYFLIVWDLVEYAKKNNILVGPGRGSAAGSLMAYVLGITNVNPIEHGLLFERFLNPDRMSHPDIDIDFQYDRRHELIDYLIRKYEWNRVAQIVTFGGMTARSVTRKVLSAFNVNQKEIKQVADQIPDELGVSIDDAMKNPEFAKYMHRYPEYYQIIRRLEDVVCQTGRHAAGVVITPGPISNYIPVHKLKSEDTLITQFAKKQLEDIGVYKFDLLGLKTLTIIDQAFQMIKENENVELTMDNIPLDDEVTYEFLRSGNLDGIFQFDGDSGKRAVKAVQPTKFEDIVACEAICRPGVKEADLYVQNKQRQDFDRCHSVVDEVLEETAGAIVYQEQVMLLVHKMAGWTLGKADSLRKVKDLDEFKDVFISDCVANGIERHVAEVVWERFDLGYTFNKSHACAYAVISYITAYLKANYYKYFMAALMNKDFDDAVKISSHITEVKKNGISIVPPDINKSGRLYKVHGDNIYFALSSILGVGDKALEAILEHRPFNDLADLLDKVPKRTVNKKVVTALIKSGCFDFCYDKRQHALDDYCFVNKIKDIETLPDNIQLEKEFLGCYLSSHPMDKYFFKPWDQYPTGIPTALIGGIIEEVKPHIDRSGKRMAFIKVDTKDGIREVTVFASVFSKFFTLISKGKQVMITGKKDGSSMLAEIVKELE